MTDFSDPPDLETKLSKDELESRWQLQRSMTPEEGDKLIVEFIRDIFPDIADLDAIKSWSDPS